MICPNCGKELTTEEIISGRCDSCGYDLNEYYENYLSWFMFDEMGDWGLWW